MIDEENAGRNVKKELVFYGLVPKICETLHFISIIYYPFNIMNYSFTNNPLIFAHSTLTSRLTNRIPEIVIVQNGIFESDWSTTEVV